MFLMFLCQGMLFDRELNQIHWRCCRSREATLLLNKILTYSFSIATVKSPWGALAVFHVLLLHARLPQTKRHN
jgi:hypothetical protein